MYLQHLSHDAFGLIGFFTVFQTWLRLLDVGITPTLSREVAHVRGSTDDYHYLRKLVRSLELFFIIVGVLVFIVISTHSRYISTSWLHIGSLDADSVSVCIALMGLMFALRWVSDLYGGGLRGFERQVLYNNLSIIQTTLQFIGGLLFICYVSTNIMYYFVYQTIIAILYLVCIAIAFYKILPSSFSVGLRFDFKIIRKVLPFALGIAYSTTVWIIVTQSDKLVFSHVLPLSEYGYLSLLIVISGAVTILSSPISIAIQPRMTMLLAQQNVKGMESLYLKSSLISITFLSAVVTCVLMYSHQLLQSWTGSMEIANWGSNILNIYVLSASIICIISFQYFLQYAYGKLKLHNTYNTISLVFFAPIVIYTAYNYGVYTTALLWLGYAIVGLIIWMPIVHHVFAKGINRYFFINLAVITIVCFLLSLIFKGWYIYPSKIGLVELILIGFAFLFIQICIEYVLFQYKVLRCIDD